MPWSEWLESRPARVRARAALLALAAALSPIGRTAAQPAAEAEVKAAFVLNFARFTEWPVEAFAAERNRLALCIVGQKEGLIEAAGRLEGKLVKQREVKVRTVSRKDELAGCHVLVFGVGPRVADLLGAAARLPVLTISDQPDFVVAGGMIELSIQNDRVGFDVNLHASRAAGLQISSQVLRLARRVSEGPPR